MKRTDFLLVVIAVLFVLNVATLVFIWQHRPPFPFPSSGPGNGPVPLVNPADFMIRELNFDEKQQQAFAALRDDFVNRTSQYRREMEFKREELLALLANGEVARADALAEKIAALQKQVELATFEHFKAVRALCTKHQKGKFDGIIQQVLRMLASPPGPPGPPPHLPREG